MRCIYPKETIASFNNANFQINSFKNAFGIVSK